jgi:hypothetical protein
MIHVFTCAAVNYLGKVRILCKSIKRHHPEFGVHLALADKKPDWLTTEKEPFDSILEIEDFDIPNEVGWIFGHTIVELSTAIKPYALKKLLKNPETDQVFYFDPDMVLFSRVDDLVETLSKGNIVLTPHQTKPENTLQAVVDNEICSLRYGIFNLGFIGVRNTEEGWRFSDWWSQRLYHFCREGLQQGLWTDQKWINFAPVFFDGVHILKSSRFNVAPWNLTTREVRGDDGVGYRVDGEPLGFYHFTGFDSGAHKIMARKYAGGNRSVHGLIKWYEDKVTAGQDENIVSTPWAFGRFSNGEPIEPIHRLIYRKRVDLQKAYPNPFLAEFGTTSYYEWFRWRAHEEHPELVGETAQGEARISEASEISLPSSGRLSWRRIQNHIKIGITDGSFGTVLLTKSWRVLKREGLQGIKYRLSGPKDDPLDRV